MNKSKKGNFRFQYLDEQVINDLLTFRSGETRIGNRLSFKTSDAKFVILGIEESVGPVANYGLKGSENAFQCFLKVFLNSQVYPEFDVSSFSILGSIKHLNEIESNKDANEQVLELDVFVEEILNEFVSNNQIPIIIGGGHNNAFPLMKWSHAKNNGLNVINLDPHADCRETSLRHSGNSFSLAIEKNMLSTYAVLGLHEAFNNEYILNFLRDNKIFHTFYEDYLTKENDLKADFIHAVKAMQNGYPIGLEIDMDAIACMPSSAISPSGWTLDQTRSYLIFAARNIKNLAYLHLPEAAPTNETENKIVGKALTYLVRDFIKNAL